jgi:hypothetical protein
MAAFNDKITITTCEGRPCWVKGRRAIFHRWTDSARPVKPANNDQETDERMQKWSVHGLVEYEDGTMEREWPSAIRFADSAEKFDAICWQALEARRDELPYTYDEPAVEIAEAPEPGQEETQDGQETPETWKECETCAHGKDNEEFCQLAEYDCKACTVRGCYCKRCREFDRWEAKEDTV